MTEPTPTTPAPDREPSSAAPSFGAVYLHRLAWRRSRALLKRQIGFGLILGWLFTLVAAFQLLFVIGATEPLWTPVLAMGLVLLGTALIAPRLLAVPERLWMRFGNILGKIVFGSVLSVIYLVLFVPVGWWMARTGPNPVTSWDAGRAPAGEGWVSKSIGPAGELDRPPRPFVLQPIFVIAHFVRRRSYFVVPALLLLLAIGMILFFVQSSAIAPFIYTLF